MEIVTLKLTSLGVRENLCVFGESFTRMSTRNFQATPKKNSEVSVPATPKEIFKASVPADFSTLQAVQSSWGQDIVKKPFFTGISTTAGCRIDATEDIFVGSNFDTR